MTLATLIGFIGAATAFLNVQITTILGRRKRRRRKRSTGWSPLELLAPIWGEVAEALYEGKNYLIGEKDFSLIKIF